jgi:hypothetical protein
MTQQRMFPDEQGASIIQGTHRPLREQDGVWDENLAPSSQVAPPSYRFARASLPVQEQRRRQQPPSQHGASRHYAGSSHAIHPEDQPYLTDEHGRSGGLVPSRIPARATSAIDEGLDQRPARTSARSYHASRTTQQQVAPVARRQQRSLHGTVYVGLTLLCMLVGFVLFSALTTWWQQTQDDLHYGMPRTSQMDAVVGHQDSAAHPSHFLALNLGGHLSVIEIQGGDVSKTVIYAGPVIYGQGADLVAITLSVARNEQGKPELILHYQNNEAILYDGKDGKFHLQPSP